MKAFWGDIKYIEGKLIKISFSILLLELPNQKESNVEDYQVRVFKYRIY